MAKLDKIVDFLNIDFKILDLRESFKKIFLIILLKLTKLVKLQILVQFVIENKNLANFLILLLMI